MKKKIFFLFLLTTKLTFGQLNGDFELWDTIYTGAYTNELINDFSVPNPFGGNTNKWKSKSNEGYGVCRTTDSYSNNYALILHNWYGYVQEAITYHDSINYIPNYLQGYFKYNKVGLAKASAQIILTKFNGTSTDTIAMGISIFDTTSSYIPFQVQINTISFQMPDSIKIIIKNAEYGQPCQQSNMVCNFLYLDDLHLSNIPLNVNTLDPKENIMEIYPNPNNIESDLFIYLSKPIDNGIIKIANSFGQIIFQKQINIVNNTIQLSNINIASGVYSVTLETKENRRTEKLIISK